MVCKVLHTKAQKNIFLMAAFLSSPPHLYLPFHFGIACFHVFPLLTFSIPCFSHLGGMPMSSVTKWHCPTVEGGCLGASGMNTF